MSIEGITVNQDRMIEVINTSLVARENKTDIFENLKDHLYFSPLLLSTATTLNFFSSALPIQS